jgi:BA14K-like protein
MISLKVLSTAAVMALVLPTASFAQVAVAPLSPAGRAISSGGGGGGGGGGARAPGPMMGAGPVARAPLGGGGGGPRFNGGGGGGYRGGYGGGGYRHRGGGGGFIPGAVAGAVIGGAIASQGYYGGPGYAPGYYDDQYYDDSVAVAPGGDDVAYCIQRFRSYDPGSGTYLGNDGFRHPCP